MTKQSLNWARFLDLRDLVLARDGIKRGSRDMVLFWMVSFLAQSGVINVRNFWDEVGVLLKSFPVCKDFNPMQDGSLGTLLARIHAQSRGERINFNGKSYSPVYTPRNDTLLNLLEISSSEELDMRTIISKREKLDRADSKVFLRAHNRRERLDMREVAATMHAADVNFSQIARVLKKNKSTISRWMKLNKLVGQPYTETRGRKPCPHKVHVKFSGLNQKSGSVTQVGSPNASNPTRQTKIHCHKAHLREDHVLWTYEKAEAWLRKRRLGPPADSIVPLFASKKNMDAAVAKLIASNRESLLRSRIKLHREAAFSVCATPCVSGITIAAP